MCTLAVLEEDLQLLKLLKLMKQMKPKRHFD
jgi:hypothetical protein